PVADGRDPGLVLPVEEEAVVDRPGGLPLDERGCRRDGDEVRDEAPGAVVERDEALLVRVFEVHLERLYVQPAVLADGEEAVVGLVVLPLAVVPDAGLVQGKSGVHPEAEEPVAVAEPAGELTDSSLDREFEV